MAKKRKDRRDSVPVHFRGAPIGSRREHDVGFVEYADRKKIQDAEEDRKTQARRKLRYSGVIQDLVKTFKTKKLKPVPPTQKKKKKWRRLQTYFMMPMMMMRWGGKGWGGGREKKTYRCYSNCV